MTRQQPFVRGEGMSFANVQEVRTAYDQEAISLHAAIKCRIHDKLEETTVGRVLLYEVVPSAVPFSRVNKVMGKKELADLIDSCYRIYGQKETVLLADRLRTVGYEHATKSGISICIKDMVIPDTKKNVLARCNKEVEEITSQYVEGLITDGERYNKVIDIWSKAAEEISGAMMETISTTKISSPDGRSAATTPSFNSLYVMADSGARGAPQQIKQLAGMRGLMAKPSGEIIETPITANFREGLNVLQYFNSTHGARKGLADTALKTANSGYLTRRLVDVAQDSIVTEFDCETLDGIEVTALVEGNDIIESVGERILGRVALEDVLDPVSGDVIVPAGEEIDEKLVEATENAGVSRVRIRSVLTCQTRRGICAKCYGRDLSRGQIVSVGEAVGVIAAQSIGEPGTQLTMQTFHIGGIASGSARQSSHICRSKGKVVFDNLQIVQCRDGQLVAMNRQGTIKIVDESGRERESYPATYGAFVKVQENTWVEPGTTLVQWDPYSVPILTEVGGMVSFSDLEEGVTVSEQVDEATGLSHSVVVESKDPNAKPQITILGDDNKPAALKSSTGSASSLLPVGAVVVVQDGQQVAPGDVLAKVNREMARTKDITGGLPRVVELFEARRPKDHAVISEITGTISFGKDVKGKRCVRVTPEVGEPREYLIPKGKYIRVRENDFVRAGEPLMDGSIDPHDILMVSGEKALAKYLVEGIQEVYHLQGVRINDKHIETIVRQMLCRVCIKDCGDTPFLLEDQVEKQLFEEENEKVLAKGGRPAIAEPLLLGITRASLSTQSFISGASFQETTKVLTDAAVASKVDYLRGLKENVIMGRLVPAGTGLPNYQYLNVQVEESGVYEQAGLMENIPVELYEGV